MFGKNAVTSPFNQTGESLRVNEIFYTLQGEGPDAGKPAVFVRLSKCNLRCYFCDTEFEAGQDMTVSELCKQIELEAEGKPCHLVVITGGEPLLQNIVPTVHRLNKFGFRVSVETAGLCFYDELEDVFSAGRRINGNLIVCSPKTPKISPQLENLVGAFKYIVRAGGQDMVTGLPNMSTQIEGAASKIYVPTHTMVPIYVQAMDEQDADKNEANLKVAARAALDHGYLLSVQMHKLAGLR